MGRLLKRWVHVWVWGEKAKLEEGKTGKIWEIKRTEPELLMSNYIGCGSGPKGLAAHAAA